MATRALIAIGLGAVLTVGACSTDREITRPEPQPVTEERLEEALIDVSDLPPGYVAEDGEGTPIATDVVPEHECDDALGELEAKESVSRDFLSSASGTKVTHNVAWFPGQGGAVEQLMRDVAEDCNGVAIADQAVSVRTSALDFGVLSAHTLAISYELEPEVGAIEERDLVLMRRGDLISLIRLTGPRPSDKALLDGAVRVAIGYLGLLADDTT